MDDALLTGEERFSCREFLSHHCKSRITQGICAGVSVILIAVIGTLIGVFVVAQETPPNKSLQFVSILFRHGDRTPTETYPNDPFNNSNVWQEGWGTLTKKGKQQLYSLGKFLRSRYGTNYLNNFYSPDDMYLVSSYSDRCLMSAQALLAGLYPPQGYQLWNPDLHWQPIPVHMTPRALDQLITVTKPCKRYDTELKNAYNSSEIQELNKKNKGLYDYLSKNTGSTIDNITAVEFLYSTLEIERTYDLTLPDWTKNVFPDKMIDLTKRSLAIFTYSKAMKRLKGGPLLKDILGNMILKRDNNLKQKMFLYSGHDVTIVNLWRTLGLEELIKPAYGASLIFELHEAAGSIGHQVKMFYLNDTTTTSPYELTLEKCGSPCTLDALEKITRPLWPVFWDEECTSS